MPALYCGRRRGRQRSKRGARHAGASVSRPQADQVVHGDDNGEHPPTRRIPPCPLLRIKPIVFNQPKTDFHSLVGPLAHSVAEVPGGAAIDRTRTL